RAGVGGRLIVLLAVDARGGAIFLGRADGEHFAVATKRNRGAELRGGLGVGSLDVGRGIPGRAAARVNVGRAGVFHGCVRLIPVDALGSAILKVRADGNGVAVAADGQSQSELVVHPRIEGPHISLFRPLACRTHENVNPVEGFHVWLTGIGRVVFIIHGSGDNGVAVVADGQR